MGRLVNTYLLPALSFKAVVIGGGYATGRELAEFFLPYGPKGGLLAMLLAAVVWSAICALTFVFALSTRSYDYRTFFQHLLGRYWVVFEIIYVLTAILMVSVFAAATGVIGTTLLGVPGIYGSLALMASITLLTMYGNKSVEAVFKIVSFFLYGIYVIFLVLAVTSFGDRIADSFAGSVVPEGWVSGTVRYSGYNLLAAVLILPVMRHITRRRDAAIAGLICGPLAMLPAIIFFVSMCAYYPEIQSVALPSNFLLERMNMPYFHLAFQAMIFGALLESGCGVMHAFNERVSTVCEKHGRVFSPLMRMALTIVVLFVAVYIAGMVGLVDLIGKGYSIISYVFITIFLLPLLTIGLWKVMQGRRAPLLADAA